MTIKQKIDRYKLNRAFKKKYAGKIIHQSGDRFGQIQVIEDGEMRSLHFDAIEKQSAMNIGRPEQLVLSYTEFMMAGFLLTEPLYRILCIGLGGASIPRFIAHYIKYCDVDIVEIRKEVVQIAIDYFLLPKDERFHYFEADGAYFVKHSKGKPYDIILVDAYDHRGIAEPVTDDEFFKGCLDQLNTNGVMSINLWSHPSNIYRSVMNSISRSFTDGIVEIPVKDRTNRIVLGTKPGWKKPTIQKLKKRSVLFEKSFNIRFSKILDIMLKNNPEFVSLLNDNAN